MRQRRRVFSKCSSAVTHCRASGRGVLPWVVKARANRSASVPENSVRAGRLGGGFMPVGRSGMCG